MGPMTAPPEQPRRGIEDADLDDTRVNPVVVDDARAPEPGRDDTPPASGTPGRQRRRRRLTPTGLLGLILIVAGLGCLGYVGWEYFGTNIVSERAASDEKANLRAQWSTDARPPAPTSGPSVDPSTGATVTPTPDAGRAPASRPTTGDAMALIRIPRFGESYEWPIIAGIGGSDLAKGVGWFPGTAVPGEVGNFALAGHRVTHGEPFRRMLELDAGDKVIIETRDAIHTYQLDTSPRDLTVLDTDNWVLDPVPGKPDQPATRALITLTTCQDLFHSADRSVAFGHLIDTQKK